MNTENRFLNKPHILHHFDDELIHLHQLALNMMHQVVHQWDWVLESLEDGNLELAVDVIAHCRETHFCEDEIEQAVLTFLAKASPVASDLRMVLSISKIAVELKYLSDEASEIAKLILVLYEPRHGIVNAQLIKDIRYGFLCIHSLLNHLTNAVGSMEINPPQHLMTFDTQCNQAIQDGIVHQLMAINHDQRQIKPTLVVLQIMKSLESSNDYCKNLTAYCVFMINGEDIRHITH